MNMENEKNMLNDEELNEVSGGRKEKIVTGLAKCPNCHQLTQVTYDKKSSDPIIGYCFRPGCDGVPIPRENAPLRPTPVNSDDSEVISW